MINYIAEDAAETAVEKVVGSAVEKAVGPAVEKAVATAQFDGQVAGLNFRVLSIDLAEGISNDDAMAIIEEIETLYSQPPNEDSRNKLVFAVETAVKNFFLIDRPDLVGRLREKVPDVFQNSDAILTTEILFQGRKLLADASAPRSWLDDLGDMRESYEDYRRYAAQAKSAYPGLYLAYELPLRHVEGRSTEEILGLIEDADNLSAENAENFDSIIIGLADASEDSDVESRRVADRVGKFLCEFQEYSMLLRYVSGNCPSCLDCPGEPMR